jgi:hypothetical protein
MLNLMSNFSIWARNSETNSSLEEEKSIVKLDSCLHFNSAKINEKIEGLLETFPQK